MSQRRRLRIALLAVCALLGAASAPVLMRHVHAVRLLSSMSQEDRKKEPGHGRTVDDLKTEGGQVIAARIYGPPLEEARRIIVLGHGIHHLGIREPRLRRFSEHLAKQGCTVLTPELDELAHYKITENGADVLAASVKYAGATGQQVGLIGFSFAGGMALLAATDPELARKLDYVASIGGYHDLARTLRFLASHHVETLHGMENRRAHEYGMLVLLNDHLEHFGLAEDQETFRAALLSWLKEDRKSARRTAATLSTKKGKDLFSLIEEQKLSNLKSEILELLKNQRAELAALSPRGHLGQIQTTVLLLHGSGDTVVPPEETQWAGLELEKTDVTHMTLVTPLLEHVRVDHPAGLGQKWQLVHFMAQLF